MATKAELIAQLTAAGIAHDPKATNKELEALLPPKTGVSPETTSIEIEGVIFKYYTNVPHPSEVLINGRPLSDTEMEAMRGMFATLDNEVVPIGVVEDLTNTNSDTRATVHDQHGHPHRTYSKELHGDNFKQLAKQFASHPARAGWTVK